VLWVFSPQARAADQGITGKSLLLKGTSKLVLLSKDPNITIAGADPVHGGDSSLSFDDGTTAATLALPANDWSTNGSGTLFKYKNASAPGGPSSVKIAKVKSGLLKVVAKGVPVPVPNGAGTISIVLSLAGGTNTYCMTFSGSGDGTKFVAKDAGPGICPGTPTPSPTPTSTPTPTPRLPDISPPGAAPLRYRDAVFSTVSMTSNVTYGSAVDNSGNTITLQLDIYEPTGDTVTARPAIVWVHGGSFCCGDKTSPEIVDEANTFAAEGYFNVSINYRLEPVGCTTITTTCIIAMEEARDDAQTAVRFLRSNAATYGIDATRIAIGGSSAGAITALHVGFASSEDPTAAVAGAVSLSGANLLSPITPGDAPSLLFHGTADPLVPYQWAVNTWNSALSAGLDSFLTTWVGAGHVPYVQHRTEILDQTTNFLYWEMDLANAAQ
jgi:acetyl esterase/lipase